jgi:hypothetical protein
MKITSLLLFFIAFAAVAYSAESVNITKGSMYVPKADGSIIYLYDSEVNSKILNTGDEVLLKELVEIKTLKDNCDLHLFFSNKMNVFFHKKGWLTVEVFEHFKDKESNGDISIILVRGRADFKLEELKEEGYMSVKTDGADLEIKSKSFYVDSSSHNTIVECYDGKIIMTDSLTLKSTTLETGNYADVYSSGGEKNVVVKIYPLKPEQLKDREERIKSYPKVEWKFKSTTN